MSSILKIKRLHPDAELPVRAHPTDAGLDLHAYIDTPVKLYSGECKVFPTGISIELPAFHEGQIRSRSGLAAKFAVSVANSPGCVDPSYTGELKVILINHGSAPFIVHNGDRIAQLVVAPIAQVVVQEVQELTATDRGDKGIGSSGI